ncbi:unnamed protein product [Penicillium nalgiovense]|uniref:Uncharacterized protein n=1 Tax=Penicillium nalgiovense TaxID=60175 RepID=A0A9W4MMI5_PENNA|nr:unnamed protein product [Penicillium nalgiovense]CAG8026222.1 unnamed protein product [Penicillium nalgiovense]CAG8034359.1 unnamed protein product [Penicillium nalgiovense]CAG8050820.1 unnamed protein product [Penicillium nalgiovense]CAG8065431.1 unnamed protein product [Penicillium nalgiovense]
MRSYDSRLILGLPKPGSFVVVHSQSITLSIFSIPSTLFVPESLLHNGLCTSFNLPRCDCSSVLPCRPCCPPVCPDPRSPIQFY